MATLLKGKDTQRNPDTGLELGICSATIPNLNPPFTLAHNIVPPGVCRGQVRQTLCASATASRRNFLFRGKRPLQLLTGCACRE